MFTPEASYLIPDPARPGAPMRLDVMAHIPKADGAGVIGRAYRDVQICLHGDIQILRSPIPLTHEHSAISAALLIAAGRSHLCIDPTTAQRLRQWAHGMTPDGVALPPPGAELREPELSGIPYALPPTATN